MSTPQVSVIIPTYNCGSYILEAIQSAHAQEMDTEIIVIDDGSTDETLELLAGVPGLQVIATRNRGISAARNTGVSRARGEFIAFLDADDRWKPNKLRVQVDAMRRDPELGCVFANFTRFNADRVFEDDQFCYFPELSGVPVVDGAVDEDAFSTFIRFGEFPTWVQTMLFRRTAIGSARFPGCQEDGRLVLSEDAIFCFDLYRRHKVGYTREPLVEVRRHATNTTRRSIPAGRLKLRTLLAMRSFDLDEGQRRALARRTRRAVLDFIKEVVVSVPDYLSRKRSRGKLRAAPLPVSPPAVSRIEVASEVTSK